jgi:hypothetical protein
LRECFERTANVQNVTRSGYAETDDGSDRKVIPNEMGIQSDGYSRVTVVRFCIGGGFFSPARRCAAQLTREGQFRRPLS